MSAASRRRTFVVIPSVVKVFHFLAIFVQDFVKFIGIILNVILIKTRTFSIRSNKFIAQIQAYIYSLQSLIDVAFKPSPVPVLIFNVSINGFLCAKLFV